MASHSCLFLRPWQQVLGKHMTLRASLPHHPKISTKRWRVSQCGVGVSTCDSRRWPVCFSVCGTRKGSKDSPQSWSQSWNDSSASGGYSSCPSVVCQAQQTYSEHAEDGGTRILQTAQVWEVQACVQSTICASSKSEGFQCSILPSLKIPELLWRGCCVNPSLIHLHRAKEHPSGTILETPCHRTIPGRDSTTGNVACVAQFRCTLTIEHVNGSEFTAAGAQLASLKLAAALLDVEEEGSPFSWQLSPWHEAAVAQASWAVFRAVGSPRLSIVH